MVKDKKERITMQDRVLDYMREFGSITSLDAIRDLGNTRLSGTIYCLKEKGYKIIAKNETGKNRWGDKTTYARYYLVEKGEKIVDEHKV